MDRFKKHIAFFLFGLFMFPMVFHAVHSALHHAEAKDCQAHVVQNSHAPQAAYFADSSEDCAICDYEFFVNEIPQQRQLKATAPPTIVHYFSFGSPLFTAQALLKQAPRAPPVFVA